MSTRASAKFDRAYKLLADSLERGEYDASKFLPSLSSLAGRAEVSDFTMWKVVDALRKEGRIVGERNCRLSPARAHTPQGQSDADTAHSTPIRRAKHRELQNRIRQDILNGRYACGSPLPSTKELMANYGVARATIRKALLALSNESVLTYAGSRFTPVAVAALSVTQPRIILIGYGWHINLTVTWGYWHQEYLKVLEMECARARIALDVVCFTRDANGLRLMDGRTARPYLLKNSTEVIGCIYEVTGRESFDDELLGTVTKWGKPVAILDEVGEWPTPRYIRQNPTIRIFRNTVSDGPARQVARYLLELRHRRAVFISPHHRWGYSVRRLKGLLETFSDIDGADIVPITSDHDPSQDEAQGNARVDLPRMMQFYAEWKKDLPHAYTSLLDHHFELLSATSGEGRIREYLDPLLNQALAVKKATVWIMVNDACAAYALDFLRRNSVDVPGKISIISFDDQPEALEKGITTYNFGNTATMMAMLGYISNPRLHSARKPIIEIEGRIIPRRTTGKPRVKG